MSFLLEIKDISKAYQATKVALNNISLHIKAGEIFGLLGVNGAGKTTLSSIIATTLRPTSGDILFNEKSIYGWLLEDYRSKIGFCPQVSNLNDNVTLQKNLIFAGLFYGLNYKEAEQRAEELMNSLNIAEYKDSYSYFLSGGYKQRFLIARALMHNPKILILDEPTVSLDPQIRRLIWLEIKKLKELGITIILTTHYLDEAEFLADRVCLLDGGRIKLIDTPSNLIKQFEKKDLEEVFIELVKEQNR
jgi:ABC-2 type transport system ATP-binding protein